MSNTKTNFTEEHQSKLEALFLKLCFKASVLAGKFGANSLTAYDILHNASMSTLKALHNQLKIEISKAEVEEDEWTSGKYEQSQLNMKKDWKEFLHLVIGYKKFQSEKASNRAAVREMKAKLAELKESNRTPEEKIKDLEASIAEMGDEDSEE